MPENSIDRKQLVHQFQIVQDTLLHLGKVTQQKNLVLRRNAYAEGLVRKASLQLLTIRHIYEAGEWHSALSKTNPNFYYVDPLAVATVLRGAYECMLTLNHVFVNPPSQDEVELRYLLWALSTLISRNQAGATPQFENDQLVRQQVRENIDEIVNHLLTRPIVQALDGPSQALIKGKLDPKAGDGWEYYIEGNILKRVSNGWHGLAERMPAKPESFTNLYKLLSLNSHPTWHSIDLIIDGFDLKGEESENFSIMDLLIAMSTMVGLFVLYDYHNLFKEVQEAFHQLPPHFKDQIKSLLASFKDDDFTF